MKQMINQITFDRYDFLIARKTIKPEKYNESVSLPNDFVCTITAAGMARVEYSSTSGTINSVLTKIPKVKSALPNSVTVSLYRKNAIIEVPFKKEKENDDLTTLLIEITNPETVERLLEKVPHNKYVEQLRGCELTSYLFAHYDIEHRVRGLADFIHDELYDHVINGALEEELQGCLEQYGMTIVHHNSKGGKE